MDGHKFFTSAAVSHLLNVSWMLQCYLLSNRNAIWLAIWPTSTNTKVVIFGYLVCNSRELGRWKKTNMISQPLLTDENDAFLSGRPGFHCCCNLIEWRWCCPEWHLARMAAVSRKCLVYPCVHLSPKLFSLKKYLYLYQLLLAGFSLVLIPQLFKKRIFVVLFIIDHQSPHRSRITSTSFLLYWISDASTVPKLLLFCSEIITRWLI